jgi:hypothetical protein
MSRFGNCLILLPFIIQIDMDYHETFLEDSIILLPDCQQAEKFQDSRIPWAFQQSPPVGA